MNPGLRTALAALVVVGLALAAWFALDAAPEREPKVVGRRGADPEPTPAPHAAPDAPRAPRSARVALRIRVLREDWCRPFPDAELRVFRHDPARMELPRDPLVLRTDRDGLAELTDVTPGPWLVCAPGVAPGDPAPATARATTSAAGEAPLVTVAAAPATLEVRCEVLARFAPRDGFSTRLVLVRTDDGSRRELPFPRVVEPGATNVVLRVPAGTYEVTTRPLGDLLLRDDERLVRFAKDGATATLHLDENPRRIELTLTGLPDDELPARVVPVPVDRLQDDRPTEIWWGPFRWHTARLVVPALRGQHRLVVHGRTRVFLAKAPASLDAEKASIALEPAVRLLVDVGAWDPVRDAGATIDVAVGEERFARILLPTFGTERPELVAPALAGELVVAGGASARVECSLADGSIAWTRELALDAPLARVRVETMRGARN